MADQGRWFKLWTSALSDPDLDNLSLEDFARWCRLGAYIKEHGNNGALLVRKPAQVLCNLFHVADFDAFRGRVSILPNVKIDVVAGETDGIVTFRIAWKNWHKYQGDLSTERVRIHRAKNRQNETPKKRGEEKRGEETRKSPSVSPPSGESQTEPLGSDNGDEPEPEAGQTPESSPEARALLEFFNHATSRAFPANVATLSLIEARLREGWSVQDCRTMIVRKWRDWRDDERMAAFIRPRTLFNRARLEEYMATLGFTPHA